MYTHPIINLLKTFTAKELMWLGKFLNSPYFNNKKKITKLFKVLKKYYPDFDSRSFTKLGIYKQLYGIKPYNDSTFRNLMSDLLHLALEFLRQEGIEKMSIDSSFYMTNELIAKGEFKLFRNKMKSLEKMIIERNTIDGDYFLNRYRINTGSFYVNLLTQKVIKKSFVISESEKMIDGIVFILSYFIIESTKHNDNLLKYSRSYNIKKNFQTVSEFIEIFNFEKLISYIKNNSLFKVPVIEVYYCLLKTFTFFENEKYYFEFKNSLLNVSKHFGMDDNNFLYTRLLDYCVVKKITGAECSFDIDKEIFLLNEIYIKNGYYQTDSNKYFPFDTYRNVLLNCISLRKLSYMEDFIITYSKKLLPKHINSIENYSFALLYFEKKMFSKALTFLNKIKFDQFVYKLDMKNLQLKINYELEQFESAISVIDTYKHFLKNNVLVSDSRRSLHNNFLSYTNMLLQSRSGSEKISIPYLAERVKKSKNVFDKVWLQDKIKDLSRKGSISILSCFFSYHLSDAYVSLYSASSFPIALCLIYFRAAF